MTADQWNKKYKVGQRVELINGFVFSSPTFTTSPAWKMYYGDHVVMVHGESRGYSLDRIKAIE